MKIKFILLALVFATTSLFGSPANSYQQSLQKNRKCRMPIPFDDRRLEADIIVVGGGAAGCILMKQLSQNGQFSVLGIEAGPNLITDPEIEAVGLPALLLAGFGQAKYFWPGWKQTLPMPGLNGRVSDWTTGMILGGGSSINGLYYGRGSNFFYSQWEGISGSDNWSLDNILETFKDLENYHGLTITPDARGENGLLNVLQTPTVSQLTTKLMPAVQTAFPGIPLVVDYNDPSVSNCIDPRAQWFINPAVFKRESSATAFLNSKVMTPEGFGVNGRKLRVLFDSVALNIEFDKFGLGIAKKVKFMRDGQLLEAKARKAVVLAGGINSSKILQLSGIGPKSVLENAGIKPVFVNRNVGKHLQNHPLMFITLKANPADNGIPPGALYAFTINNIYLPVVGGSASDPRMLQILFEYVPGLEPLLILGFELLNPKSEGSVNIQSDNVFQIAAADDGFYQDPVDLQNMKDAIKVYIRDLLDQLALVDPPFYKPIKQDPINGVIDENYNDFVVEQYVKNNSNLSDVHHFTSHCKMASSVKAGGVVDGDTRVFGTKNVFIADNSICPAGVPDINTAAAAMMIGLRSSKIIKNILKGKPRCERHINQSSAP